MSEITLLGSDEKRLTVHEQKKLDKAAAKNGVNPVKVTNQETHTQAVVNGLSDKAIDALSGLLDDNSE